VSYRKKHVKSKIYRARTTRPIFTRIWFLVSFLFILIILSSLYFVLFYEGVQVKNIVIYGNVRVKSQDLQNIVLEHATTGLINFWNIKIVSRSIFLVNNGRINDAILRDLPEIEKIEITKNLPQTLIVNTVERQPIGIFCRSASSDSAVEECFQIDASGTIFGGGKVLSSGVTIVRQYVEEGQVFAGEKVIAQSIISAISNVQKMLKDSFQIDLKEALVSSPVRLNITTGENWKIYLDLGPGADVDSQITKLSLLLNGGISGSKGDTNRKSLRYIDLRPKDRAIVCDNSTCGE